MTRAATGILSGTDSSGGFVSASRRTDRDGICETGALGWCTPDSGLEEFLRRELIAGDAPTDISEELVRLAVEHAPSTFSCREMDQR